MPWRLLVDQASDSFNAPEAEAEQSPTPQNQFKFESLSVQGIHDGGDWGLYDPSLDPTSSVTREISEADQESDTMDSMAAAPLNRQCGNEIPGALEAPKSPSKPRQQKKKLTTQLDQELLQPNLGSTHSRASPRRATKPKDFQNETGIKLKGRLTDKDVEEIQRDGSLSRVLEKIDSMVYTNGQGVSELKQQFPHLENRFTTDFISGCRRGEIFQRFTGRTIETHGNSPRAKNEPTKKPDLTPEQREAVTDLILKGRTTAQITEAVPALRERRSLINHMRKAMEKGQGKQTMQNKKAKCVRKQRARK